MLRVKVCGHKDLATVVEFAAAIAADEWVQFSGTWVNDRTRDYVGVKSKSDAITVYQHLPI